MTAGRTVNVGLLVTTVLLVASGLGYRTLESRFNRPTGSVPIAPGTLGRLPLELGDWKGKDVELDDAIVKATDTDDHVNRTYWRSSDNAAVSMFMAYGVRFRDLAPHRPEVCYPGAGWTLIDSTEHNLELAETSPISQLPCQVHRFRRSGLASETVTVLNYYIVDGRYCPDVSLLRSKAWRQSLEAHYAAQIQISCGGPIRSLEQSERSVKEFAALSAPVISSLLNDIVASAMQGAANLSPQAADSAE